METTVTRRPLGPGDPAPDFTLPAADSDGTLSLAEHCAGGPVLLAILRGIYCAYCRRQVALVGTAAAALRDLGVQTLAVVASPAERARLYFRHRPPACRVGADPDLTVHQAYGVPQGPVTPEIRDAVESGYVRLARQQGFDLPEGPARETFHKADGVELTENDRADRARHQAQFVGHFLIDRGGRVRWADIECGRDGVAGLYRFPTAEQIVAEARALAL
jgi:peroxiredoxin